MRRTGKKEETTVEKIQVMSLHSEAIRLGSLQSRSSVAVIVVVVEVVVTVLAGVGWGSRSSPWVIRHAPLPPLKKYNSVGTLGYSRSFPSFLSFSPPLFPGLSFQLTPVISFSSPFSASFMTSFLKKQIFIKIWEAAM